MKMEFDLIYYREVCFKTNISAEQIIEKLLESVKSESKREDEST